MIRFIHLIGIACLTFCTSLSAKIISTSHLDEVQEYFENLDPQSLVMWDVDETLIVPADKILNPKNESILQKMVQTYIGRSNEKMPELMSQVLSRASFVLVDPKSPNIISSLKNKGIPLMAFTAMQTGKLGIIPSMEDWRIHQLRQLDIDFSNFFPQYSGLSWQEKTKLRIGLPAFKEGILCSDHLEKGPVLESFLKKIDWKPSQIIFLDDNFLFLVSVEQALEGLNIPFVGIHYLGAELIYQPVDLDVAKHQLQVLAEKGIWLTDQEAESALQKAF